MSSSILKRGPEPKRSAPEEPAPRPAAYLLYLLLGTFFGIVLVKSQVLSWFRIQEMFRFDSFHMYGILGSAIAVAALALALIRRAGWKTRSGAPALLPSKATGSGRAEIAGGTLFGIGWALLGACPGPIYGLLGTGISVMLVALASAVAGAWAYGHLRPKLPH